MGDQVNPDELNAVLRGGPDYSDGKPVTVLGSFTKIGHLSDDGGEISIYKPSDKPDQARPTLMRYEFEVTLPVWPR